MNVPPRDEPALTFRAALPRDQPFLNEMLWMAHSWRDAPHPPTPSRLPEPTRRYADGFGRPGDHGVIALCDGFPAGAAWWRHRTSDDPGYGYLAEDIPELTVAVRPAQRRKGLAAAMLSWLTREAAKHDLAALCLSVEKDNPAVGAYRAAGFVVVLEDEDALTMKLDIVEP